MTGNELASAISTSRNEVSSPIITDLLYANSVFMLTGEAGKGKSVIATQLAISLSSATPMFGSLTIPNPKRVYYLQLEGYAPDYFRRMFFMASAIKANYSNIYWDADKKFNAMDEGCTKAKVLHITNAFPKPDVIILDPIYKAVYGDLSRAEVALALIRFSDLLTDTFGSTVVLIHHPHREKHTLTGKLIKETDAYYGHSFIRNHIDTAYVFSQIGEDGQLSKLERTKLREERSLHEIILRYHPETYTCTMEAHPTQETKKERVEAFLTSHAKVGTSTTFAKVKAACSIGDTFLREIQSEWFQDGRLRISREDGKVSIWIPKMLHKPDTKDV